MAKYPRAKWPTTIKTYKSVLKKPKSHAGYGERIPSGTWRRISHVRPTRCPETLAAQDPSGMLDHRYVLLP